MAVSCLSHAWKQFAENKKKKEEWKPYRYETQDANKFTLVFYARTYLYISCDVLHLICIKVYRVFFAANFLNARSKLLKRFHELWRLRWRIIISLSIAAHCPLRLVWSRHLERLRECSVLRSCSRRGSLVRSLNHIRFFQPTWVPGYFFRPSYAIYRLL